ncbi:GyrI-like domain-containing protein [Halobacillus sp. B23F22_1]|uniref:GyrI-like domain-containing protein n=1 Tax=Halobacillus sp. B23F22_1 TaxID=3459514 RepID=UPI00373F621F
MSESRKIIEIPAYRAVGMKWDGAYSEISSLKQMIQTMSERVQDIPQALNPHLQLGLSYHLRPDGFIHYSVYEVEREAEIPEGMIEFNMPRQTYVKVHHHKGKDIGLTYAHIREWFKTSPYVPYREKGVTYFDELPIKHEHYPKDRDINDPHFHILIPIVKKSRL